MEKFRKLRYNDNGDGLMYSNKKRKSKNKLQKRNIILISLLVFALITGLIANIMTTNRKLTIFEKAIKDSVLFVEQVITSPVRFVKLFIEENKDLKNFRIAYRNMEAKVESIDRIMAEKDDLEHQLKELQNLLELTTTLSDYEPVNATVINRNVGYWYDTITIDKGETHGIESGMPVIVSKGLIGKVTKTSLYTSTVKLLTADTIDEKISIRIGTNEEYSYGLLTGYDYKTGNYIIEGIADNVNIFEGYQVTTTGMGDIFPSGILIGKVVDIRTDNFDLARIVEVKSDIDFDDLNYVSVLKRNSQ